MAIQCNVEPIETNGHAITATYVEDVGGETLFNAAEDIRDCLVCDPIVDLKWVTARELYRQNSETMERLGLAKHPFDVRLPKGIQLNFELCVYQSSLTNNGEHIEIQTELDGQSLGFSTEFQKFEVSGEVSWSVGVGLKGIDVYDMFARVGFHVSPSGDLLSGKVDFEAAVVFELVPFALDIGFMKWKNKLVYKVVVYDPEHGFGLRPEKPLRTSNIWSDILDLYDWELEFGYSFPSDEPESDPKSKAGKWGAGVEFVPELECESTGGIVKLSFGGKAAGTLEGVRYVNPLWLIFTSFKVEAGLDFMIDASFPAPLTSIQGAPITCDGIQAIVGD